MADNEMLAMEGRIRRTIVRAGAVAGVTAVLSAVLIVVLIAIARFAWISYEEKLAADAQAQTDRAQAVVSPEFASAARAAIDLVRDEHAAAARGWSPAKAAEKSAYDTIIKLGNLAQTKAETSVWMRLSNIEASYSVCVEGAIEPLIAHHDLPRCEKEHPLAELGRILPPITSH